MRLIIDIPEERYANIKEEQWMPNRLLIEKAIANGIPLEQIRAEIEQIIPYDYPCDKRTPEHIRDMAVEIVEKYAEQEPKTEIECFSKDFVRALRKYAEQAEIQADYDRQKSSGMTDEEWEYGKGGE